MGLWPAVGQVLNVDWKNVANLAAETTLPACAAGVALWWW